MEFRSCGSWGVFMSLRCVVDWVTDIFMDDCWNEYV
jgi:hypothetical protein